MPPKGHGVFPLSSCSLLTAFSQGLLLLLAADSPVCCGLHGPATVHGRLGRVDGGVEGGSGVLCHADVHDSSHAAVREAEQPDM